MVWLRANNMERAAFAAAPSLIDRVKGPMTLIATTYVNHSRNEGSHIDGSDNRSHMRDGDGATHSICSIACGNASYEPSEPALHPSAMGQCY
jgi:hypothetical protein